MVSDWESYRRAIRQSVADGTWDRWFEPLTATEADDTLIIHTSSDLHTRWLRDRYMPMLEQAARSIYGHTNIDFETVPAARLDIHPEVPALAESTPTPATPEHQPAPALMSRYSFEAFVVGQSNRFAHAAAQAVAEQPGTQYNPLLIYSNPGLGKTHLLHAVGHLAHLLDPTKVIRYVTSEQFLNEFIEAIGKGTSRVDAFKARYREVDVFLLDDIQFFVGKERVREEIFHTFNALYEAGKQMVFTSDRHPKHLDGLEERLRSRLEMGLLIDIQPPDIETRLAILQRNADMSPVPVPNNVLWFIAEHIHNNIRELEGALIRVTAHARLSGEPITLERVRQLLHDITSEGATALDCSAIMAVTADAFGFHPDDLTSKSRKQPLVIARQVAMYLSRELTDDSLVQIGSAFNRDHSTVLHSVDKVKQLMADDRTVFEKVNNLSQRLRTTP